MTTAKKSQMMPGLYLTAIKDGVQHAIRLTKEGEVEEATEHVDAIERLATAYRLSTGNAEHEAIHLHFSLSYANYLVVPRTLLQSMPDVWQARLVALLNEMGDAFQDVPQAEVYDVTAATEHEVSDLDDAQLADLGIVQDWYRGETPPAELTGVDLSEWQEQHEDPDGPKYSRNGQELDRNERVLLSTTDPVPHYNRGRTRVEPRLGGGV